MSYTCIAVDGSFPAVAEYDETTLEYTDGLHFR
jgi:hypothetical protein